MFRKGVGIVLVVVVFFALGAPLLAAPPAAQGLDWLKTKQQADGGFTSGFSEGSDLGTTCDVILAIAAAGQDPSTWRSADDRSPLDYLAAQVAAGDVEKVGLKAKVVLALVATMLDPTDFAGHDLIAELKAAYNSETGTYGSTLYDHTLIMLALFNAGQSIPEGAADYLVENQTTDGAWAFTGGTTEGTGDTNTTALAVQALLAAGRRDPIGGAVAYFRRVQNEDGGFPYQKPSPYGTETDANSTALVLQALMAADEPLDGWAVDAARGALEGLYDPESGAFFWQASAPFPNVSATAQAIPALEANTFLELGRVGVATLPEPAAGGDGALLPESGAGGLVAPIGWLVVGVFALVAGLRLRREWMGR